MWAQLGAALETAREKTVGVALKALGDAKARRDAATFSMALIALSAKIAKADGAATDDEFAAFEDFFAFPKEEAPKVRMIYDLAKQDVAGFEHYVKQVAELYAAAPAILEDVVDCLFHIAAADGVAHPRELEMLETAAKAFGIAPGCFARIKAAHLGIEGDDPLFILGLPPDADADAVKGAFRRLARLHHPDALVARGVPEHLVGIAQGRMAAINDAYARAMERANGVA
ncbi:MAG: molecular chaperone DjiA [Alphaproteobacteria bacterium]|nr:molecular chaperone DjiA [Alphaproteobacteria bacterium]